MQSSYLYKKKLAGDKHDDKLSLSLVKLRLNWSSMLLLSLPLSKLCIKRVETYFVLYGTATKLGLEIISIKLNIFSITSLFSELN